jgi:hypothetical protein
MDIGTAKDMIEDMHNEIIALRKEITHLEKVIDKAYSLAGGHLHNCRMGMWCNCGYMLYTAHKETQK